MQGQFILTLDEGGQLAFQALDEDGVKILDRLLGQTTHGERLVLYDVVGVPSVHESAVELRARLLYPSVSPERRNCPECGQSVRIHGGAFGKCLNCGATVRVIPAEKRCPECGYLLEDRGSFLECPNCRHAVPNQQP